MAHTYTDIDTHKYMHIQTHTYPDTHRLRYRYHFLILYFFCSFGKDTNFIFGTPQAQTHIITYAHIDTHTQIHTHMHTYRSTPKHTETYTDTCMFVHTCIHIHRCACGKSKEIVTSNPL